jgi:DNA-binding XRE family transcriptional regulator
VAGAAIAAEVCVRARAFDDALADALNELVNEWGMSRARMAALLGCPHMTIVPFELMKINDTLCVAMHSVCEASSVPQASSLC